LAEICPRYDLDRFPESHWVLLILLQTSVLC